MRFVNPPNLSALPTTWKNIFNGIYYAQYNFECWPTTALLSKVPSYDVILVHTQWRTLPAYNVKLEDALLSQFS